MRDAGGNRLKLRTLPTVLVALLFVTTSALVAGASRPVAVAEASAADVGCEPDLPVGHLIVPLPEGEAPETHACWGKIQPGARMTSPAWCTMNWVFRDGAGNLYIGTAGHCTGHVGQRVSVDGVGDFGAVAYRVNGGPGNDFALVKVDADKVDRVDPTLCHWGGPSALYAGGAGVDSTLMHYGWGAELYYRSAATRARLAELTGVTSDRIDYVGLTNGGDSGSPVMSEDGTALGVHTHRSLVTMPFVGLSPKFGTRLDVAVERAESAMGVDLSLVEGTLPPDLTGNLLRP